MVTAVRTGVRTLGEADRTSIEAFVAADPVAQCVFASRLATAGSLTPFELGGQLWGFDGPDGLRAACFSGGNLMPVGGELTDLRELAARMARGRRVCSSIVGRDAAVLAMWPQVRSAWGPARAVRPAQPLLAISAPSTVAPDPEVTRVTPRDLQRYLPAALAMFSEELQVAPPASGVKSPYRARVSQLIGAGLAFARFDRDGRVVFKAEIAAVSPRCCQVQGVWVDPDLRGRGIGTAAMAAVIAHGLRLAPVVSLYVNDYNATARSMYQRLGMRQVATFATVLF